MPERLITFPIKCHQCGSLEGVLQGRAGITKRLCTKCKKRKRAAYDIQRRQSEKYKAEAYIYRTRYRKRHAEQLNAARRRRYHDWEKIIRILRAEAAITGRSVTDIAQEWKLDLLWGEKQWDKLFSLSQD